MAPSVRIVAHVFFFSSRRRHTRFDCDWSSDVCSSDLLNQTLYNGEVGTYHNNTGVFTVTDNGLAVVANAASTNATSAITIAGSGIALNNALTGGHWMDVLTFVMNTPGVGTHTATIIARNGAGPEGTTLVTVTSGVWTTSGSSSGTVTFYVDLGTASLTAPVTVYVNVT